VSVSHSATASPAEIVVEQLSNMSMSLGRSYVVRKLLALADLGSARHLVRRRIHA
jgi:hypothetical protein